MAIRGAETFSCSENGSDGRNVLALGATHIDGKQYAHLITVG